MNLSIRPEIIRDMRIRLSGSQPLHDPAIGAVPSGAIGASMIIDASELTFASPLDLAGVAAWASRLRHDGHPVDFVIPADGDVSRYLVRMDLIDHLARAGVTISAAAPSVRRADRADVLLEVRRIYDPETVDRFTEDAYELALLHTTPGSAAAAATIVAELLDNAITHAASPVGVYAAAQVHQHGGDVELAIADAGMGIRSHLARNPGFRDLTAAQAISAALRPGVTGTSEQRGNGLPDLLNTASGFGGQLLLRSDDGFAEIRAAPAGRQFSTAGQVTGTWAWVHVRLPRGHRRMVSLQQ
jgi:hypothetical protein